MIWNKKKRKIQQNRWILFGFRLSKNVSNQFVCVMLFKGQTVENRTKCVDITTDAHQEKHLKIHFPVLFHSIEHNVGTGGNRHIEYNRRLPQNPNTLHQHTPNAFNLRMWPSSANDNYNYRCVSSDDIGFCLIIWWVFSSYIEWSANGLTNMLRKFQWIYIEQTTTSNNIISHKQWQ